MDRPDPSSTAALPVRLSKQARQGRSVSLRRGLRWQSALAAIAVVAVALLTGGLLLVLTLQSYRHLDEMDRLWRIGLRRAAGLETTAPADRLAGMFDALLWDGHPEDYRGAAFLKASAEARAGSAVHLRVAEHRAGVLGWIHRLTRQADAADPDGLASQLALLLEGALALSMGALDPETPRQAQAAARHIIHEALLPAPNNAPAATGFR